jgi:hypothetical protein
MKPLIGGASAALQYLMFINHPILSLYPRLIDGALGQGAFAAVILLLNLAASIRSPYTAAFSATTLYLAESALSSPILRALLPLPELPQPDGARRRRTLAERLNSQARRGNSRGACGSGSRRIGLLYKTELRTL